MSTQCPTLPTSPQTIEGVCQQEGSSMPRGSVGSTGDGWRILSSGSRAGCTQDFGLGGRCQNTQCTAYMRGRISLNSTHKNAHKIPSFLFKSLGRQYFPVCSIVLLLLYFDQEFRSGAFQIISLAGLYGKAPHGTLREKILLMPKTQKEWGILT